MLQAISSAGRQLQSEDQFRHNGKDGARNYRGLDDPNCNSAIGRPTYYVGATGATAADGGIWRPALDKHNEYVSPFELP